jgi:outer membrane lipoprotein carrier protein
MPNHALAPSTARNAQRWLVSAVSLLLIVLSARAADAGGGAATLERYLEGLASFEADFTQEIADAKGKVTERASGRLYLQKPGRFRWEYREPNEQLIVSDGRNIWLYDKDLEQVTVKTVDESLSSTPALLLAGKAGVADSFAVTDAGVRDGVHWLELTPKRNDTDFVRLTLGFARDALRTMELEDKLAQHTRIEFDAAKRNPRLSAGLFAFQPPPGADVIGKPQ